MTNQRNRQTREQIRMEKIKTAITAVMLLVILSVLTVWALGIWAEHPGEQPISGQVYVESIMDGVDSGW